MPRENIEPKYGCWGKLLIQKRHGGIAVFVRTEA